MLTKYEQRCYGKPRLRVYYEEGIIQEANSYTLGKAISISLSLNKWTVMLITDMEGNIIHDFR